MNSDRAGRKDVSKMRLSVTYILIGINILIFAAETMAGGSRNKDTALRFGVMYTP